MLGSDEVMYGPKMEFPPSMFIHLLHFPFLPTTGSGLKLEHLHIKANSKPLRTNGRKTELSSEVKGEHYRDTIL